MRLFEISRWNLVCWTRPWKGEFLLVVVMFLEKKSQEVWFSPRGVKCSYSGPVLLHQAGTLIVFWSGWRPLVAVQVMGPPHLVFITSGRLISAVMTVIGGGRSRRSGRSGPAPWIQTESSPIRINKEEAEFLDELMRDPINTIPLPRRLLFKAKVEVVSLCWWSCVCSENFVFMSSRLLLLIAAELPALMLKLKQTFSFLNISFHSRASSQTCMPTCMLLRWVIVHAVRGALNGFLSSSLCPNSFVTCESLFPEQQFSLNFSPFSTRRLHLALTFIWTTDHLLLLWSTGESSAFMIKTWVLVVQLLLL